MSIFRACTEDTESRKRAPQSKRLCARRRSELLLDIVQEDEGENEGGL